MYAVLQGAISLLARQTPGRAGDNLMNQETITEIHNLLRSITEAAESALISIDALSELAQRPSIRKHLSTKQLNVLTSLAALALDVHTVTCDLRIAWNETKGNRP
jgi:hypothetical protein